jgi:hypothetical protein
MLAGQLPHRENVRFGQDGAAAAVVGVLQADQRCARKMDIAMADAGRDLLHVQPALVVVGHGAQAQAADGMGAAHLEVQGVRLVADDDFVAAAAVDQHRHQVALGAAGGQERRFLPQHFGGQRLQTVYGRIIAEDVVPQLGVGDGLPHRR